MLRRLLVTGLCLVAVTTPVRGAGLALAPEAACSYLAEAGLPAANDYRPFREEQFYCWSLRRDLPAGDPVRHRVRYTAEGTAEAVSALVLELQVVSGSEVQRAHRLFLEHAKTLARAATGQDLPEAVGKAILSARPGRWREGETDFVVQKSSVRAPTSYELVLRIE